MKTLFKKLLSSKTQSKHFSETVQRVGKNNAGFSLVELIVVIAIMAILATVAVIGVSVYIPKAQKAGDEQTISDVIDALTLHYYSDPENFTGGYVVIAPKDSGSSSADEFGNAAMEATFGTDWKNSVKLQYDGWTNTAGSVSVDYANSSYQANQEQLLTDIQQLTNALQTFVENSGTQFIGTDYTDFANKYGIDVEDSVQVSNAATLFVAEQTKSVNKDEFVKEWTRNYGAGYDLASANFAKQEIGNLGIMGQLAAHYARAESLAIFVDAHYSDKVSFTHDGNPVSASEWLSKQPVSGTNTDEVVTNITNITNQFAGYLGDATQRVQIIQAYGASDIAKADAEAYVSMMGAIVENSDELLDNVDKEGNMYTDGTVDQLLNDYMTAGSALVNCPAGSIAIVISAKDDGINVIVVGMEEK